MSEEVDTRVLEDFFDGDTRVLEDFFDDVLDDVVDFFDTPEDLDFFAAGANDSAMGSGEGFGGARASDCRAIRLCGAGTTRTSSVENSFSRNLAKLFRMDDLFDLGC